MEQDYELRDHKPQQHNQMDQFNWLHSTIPNPQRWLWTTHPLKNQGQSSVESNSTHISPSGHLWQGLDFLHTLTGSLEAPSVVILCYMEFSEAYPWAASLLFTTQSTTVPAAGG